MSAQLVAILVGSFTATWLYLVLLDRRSRERSRVAETSDEDPREDPDEMSHPKFSHHARGKYR